MFEPALGGPSGVFWKLFKKTSFVYGLLKNDVDEK